MLVLSGPSANYNQPVVRLDYWLRFAEDRLLRAGSSSPRLDAQLLAAHLLGHDRSWILAHPEAFVPEFDAESLLQRRESQEPLAYIVGWREFYGRKFAVGPGVLIPRQETEGLVEIALAHGPSNARVLDLGTGSGCIAVTLKLERPQWRVVAVDISPTAIGIAAGNARELQADVVFVQADALSGFSPETRFDIIVSNPPYVALSDSLPSEVRDFEPAEALFGGEDGLDFYRLLASQAGSYLASGGQLLVEIAPTTPYSELFADWRDVSCTRDLSGNPRVVRAIRPSE
jgi:release factor glutamine methyltransferase